jgi:hypothetical protein
MTSDAKTVDEYLRELSPDRREFVSAIRAAITDNLPPGFEERMSYGMIGYVVPHEHYPAGYHCDPALPLPFINLASQKASVNLYHMAIYTMPDLLSWFETAWSEATSVRLDMGKSCMRFKRLTTTPVELIGELASRVTVEEWIALYEEKIKR